MTFCIRQIVMVLTCLVMLLAMGISACKPDTVEPPQDTTSKTLPTQTHLPTSTPTTTPPPPTKPTTTPTFTSTSSLTIAPTTSTPATTLTPTQTPTPTPTFTHTTPPPPPTTQDYYSQYYHSYIFEGYPAHVWPLYGSLAIDSCAFNIQTPAYNNMGEYSNSYSIIYVTEKTREEISSFYNSLLGEPTVPGGFYDAKGIIDGYEVDARWDDYDSDYRVYLSVKLPNSEPATPDPYFKEWPVISNPYLVDFPDDVFPLYKFAVMWAEDYSVRSNQPKGQTFASKMYTHSGNKAEALVFYRELLASSQNYKEVEKAETHGKSYTLTGILDGYQFNIIVGVWGREDMIQVTIIGVPFPPSS